MVRSNHKALLAWCKTSTSSYEGVNVTDFSKSWADGLAFCALLHFFSPASIDFKGLAKSEAAANAQLAFEIARESFGIHELLHFSDLAPKPSAKLVCVKYCCMQL
jgi:hypothetical protein